VFKPSNRFNLEHNPQMVATHGVEPLAQIEDIFYQASTRGGRPFDSILAGKAQFKDGANIVGENLTQVVVGDFADERH
jgi:hypothetical protein